MVPCGPIGSSFFWCTYIYTHNNPEPETILITYNYKYIYSSAPSKRAVAAEDKTSATAPDTSRLGLEIPSENIEPELVGHKVGSANISYIYMYNHKLDYWFDYTGLLPRNRDSNF